MATANMFWPLVPGPTVLACLKRCQFETDLTGRNVTRTMTTGRNLTCVPIEQRGVTLRTRKYNDANRSGTQDNGETYLTGGWNV